MSDPVVSIEALSELAAVQLLRPVLWPWIAVALPPLQFHEVGFPEAILGETSVGLGAGLNFGAGPHGGEVDTGLDGDGESFGREDGVLELAEDAFLERMGTFQEVIDPD